MRYVHSKILEAHLLTGVWRWLDAGEVTEDGDLWDFPGSNIFRKADPGYEVRADEEHDVMRRVADNRSPEEGQKNAK